MDNFLARSICIAAARLAPREMLVMPTIPYGYNEHALDFPGTIHVTYEHFIEYCLDVCKSVAYAGFERIILVDGHGSNEHLCEFIARRATLETDAHARLGDVDQPGGRGLRAVRESGHGRRGACLRTGDLGVSLSGAIPRAHGPGAGPLRRRGGDTRIASSCTWT